MLDIAERAKRYFRANSARTVCRKPVTIRSETPLISFTFDDFPRTAWLTGGEILGSFGVAGTYYAALGCMGGDSPSGQIFSKSDLKPILDAGHELGSHTYSHCDSWKTTPEAFEKSIIENQMALSSLIPGEEFKTFSYPIRPPRPETKRRTAKYFRCSRGLRQSLNSGAADLNQLSAFFIERADDGIRTIRDLIDRNKKECGWIIFVTHDVAPKPSRFGCTAELLEDTVAYAVESGARILPVAKALECILETSWGERAHAQRETPPLASPPVS
jgi:peptidoglycan/xylan/chitin deacetylase (PgdA/CDA1 family)